MFLCWFYLLCTFLVILLIWLLPACYAAVYPGVHQSHMQGWACTWLLSCKLQLCTELLLCRLFLVLFFFQFQSVLSLLSYFGSRLNDIVAVLSCNVPRHLLGLYPSMAFRNNCARKLLWVFYHLRVVFFFFFKSFTFPQKYSRFDIQIPHFFANCPIL